MEFKPQSLDATIITQTNIIYYISIYTHNSENVCECTLYMYNALQQNTLN